MSDHLQNALEYRRQFPVGTAAYAAVDGLIDHLIENGTFTSAGAWEHREYIRATDTARKEARHA
ncbi:hypothetical protein L1080_004255 [Rhodococcus sp. MSC1_016]|uniref:hypothetical protein n=1 Tax=Rhodococcus sp. MSC1_016 TaxID=2909266 RepID=UPI00202EEC93|nr:hypothetical protein [Rhodococcus sp. MSC1_016]